MEQLLDLFTKTSIEKKLMVLLGALVVLGALDYFMVMSGQLEERQVLAAQNEDLQVRLLDKQQKAKNLAGFKREVERLKQRLREAEEQLPKKSEIPKLLRDIAYEGQQSGLLITEFNLKAEEKRGTFAAVPVSMAVEGSFHEIAVFFDRLSKLSRIVNVTDMTLDKPKVVNKKIMLGGSYLATTYRFLEADERAAEAPAEKPGKRNR